MPQSTASPLKPELLPRSYDDLRCITPSNILSSSIFGGKKVVRIAPGILVKYAGDCAEEVICTLFARDELSLPVARILYHPGDAHLRPAWRMPRPEDPPPSVWYICMEEVPGVSLDKVIDNMTEEALHNVARQLKYILSQMQTVNCKTLGSVTGHAFRNLLVPFGCQPTHPFTSVAEFIDLYRQLLHSFMLKDYAEQFLAPLPLDSPMRFSHGDLLPKNIMVDPEVGTITAVLDWELSGIYPEFWEYCRMYSPFLMTPGWRKVLQIVFPGEPREEEINAVTWLIHHIENQLGT